MTMDGKVVLVTGSTDGIGKQTAYSLASKGAIVLLHGRNPSKGEMVQEEIRRTTGNTSLQFFQAELSSAKSIQKLADQIKESHDRLDVLINNAGTFERERSLTDDGLETTFAVNYLAQFRLVHELLDLLKRSASSRIVNVASDAHWNARTMDWSNLQGEERYDGYEAYAQSKLAVVLFTYALARRLEGNRRDCQLSASRCDKDQTAQGGLWRSSRERRRKREPGPQFTLPHLRRWRGFQEDTSKNANQYSPLPSAMTMELQEKLWQVSEELTGWS